MIAQLAGATYVERTALYDIKTRHRTKKAIEKALRLQMEGRGFGFVEVLAECPTHLKLSLPRPKPGCAIRWCRCSRSAS